MTVFSYIFSFLCSQDPSRSFAIGGHLLPFCQRCTGVYLGLGITFIYLLVSRHYKKGLPPRSVIYVNIASLLIMPVFGFHFLDPGPAWRLWSGLIFGNAIAYLLLPAASIICNEGRRVAASKPALSEAEGPKALGMASADFTIPKLCLRLPQARSTYSFFALFAFLNTLALWFPIQSSLFYYAVLTFALIGLLCVLFCLVSVMAFLIKKIAVSLISTLISRIRAL